MNLKNDMFNVEMQWLANWKAWEVESYSKIDDKFSGVYES